jgi:outer membrane protein assembly factor BamB
MFPTAAFRPHPFLAGILATTLIAIADGADWPSLRGPGDNGQSAETGWKSSGELKILWKAQVGLGHSAIVVAGGRAYTLGHDGAKTDTLWCFDSETGKEIWKHSYPHPLDDLYFPGGTTGTPTVDGGVVYSLARRGQLFCLDATTGAVKWQKHLTDDLGRKMPDWGFTGAPRVHGDLLLINAGEAGLALTKTDGSVVWQSEAGTAGYSTPVVFTRDGKDLAIFTSKDGYTCVEAATGKAVWFYKHKTRYGVNATEPVIDGEHLFIATGYDKGCALLKWAAGTAEPVEAWRHRDMRNQMNPSLLIGGYLYGIDGDEGKDGTSLKCLSFETGETKWAEPAIGHGAITAADGKLIVLTENGELQIGPASPDGFSPTVKVKAVGPKCWTVPVLANGRVFCRSSTGEVAVVDVK